MPTPKQKEASSETINKTEQNEEIEDLKHKLEEQQATIENLKNSTEKQKVKTAKTKTLGFKINELGDKMKIEAKKLELQNFLINNTDCSEGVKATCTYTLSGNVSAIATGDINIKNTENVVLIFAKDSDPLLSLVNMGMLIRITNPSLSPDENGKIIKNTLGKMQKNNMQEGQYKYQYKGYNYTILFNHIIGIWFTVEKQ